MRCRSVLRTLHGSHSGSMAISSQAYGFPEKPMSKCKLRDRVRWCCLHCAVITVNYGTCRKAAVTDWMAIGGQTPTDKQEQ